MHAKTSEENIHAIRYLQAKPIVVVDTDALLRFNALPFPSCSKNPSMPHPPRVLQENSKYPGVWERERENNERAPKLNSPSLSQEPANWSSEAFLLMRPLLYSFSIIFLQFPSHMQPMTFHLPFLLISIIFINECAKIPFCLLNALLISFVNFLNHKEPNEHPSGCFPHHLAWNTCPIICGIYIFLHGIFTRVVTETYPLGEHHPWCSMTPITNKTTENKAYFPCSFIT